MAENKWPPVSEINRVAWEITLLEMGGDHVPSLMKNGSGAGLRQPKSEELLIDRSLRKSGNAEQIEAAREVVRKQLADEQQKRSDALRAGANRYEQLLSLDTEAMDALYNDLKERSRRLKADHAKPDFKHWARMDAWTIEEGLCLAFSIKPGILGEAIPPTLELPGEKYVSFFSSHFSAEVLLGKELAHEFSSACELAERSFGKAEFKRKAYPPEDFLCWAERKRIQICTELMEAAKDHQRHIKMMLSKLEELRHAKVRIAQLEEKLVDLNSKKQDETPPPKALHHKKERSYLLLLGALLFKQGIDWRERGAASKLGRLVNKIGENINDDTSRSILNALDDKELGATLEQLRNKIEHP
ncbi:hypothetical protein [Spongiibacter marinus]|uniref:hypothetical protein n=1 Tax=Spongiibacter marinus TaxID=354246 RepID=UPI00040B6D4B|nr:hypothetical protein [Spongiibacter marinus]